MRAPERREPYESRDSRTVLGGPGSVIPPGYSLRVAAPGPQPNAAHSAHAQPRYRGESTKTRGALRPSLIHTGHKKLQGRSFLPCNTPSLLIWRSCEPYKTCRFDPHCRGRVSTSLWRFLLYERQQRGENRPCRALGKAEGDGKHSALGRDRRNRRRRSTHCVRKEVEPNSW